MGINPFSSSININFFIRKSIGLAVIAELVSKDGPYWPIMKCKKGGASLDSKANSQAKEERKEIKTYPKCKGKSKSTH